MPHDVDRRKSAFGAPASGEQAAGGALRGRLALAGLVVLGAAARFWAIDFGLPYTQARPDETFIIDVALSLLKGEFWPPFYDYPRLYPYAVALLYLGYYAWGALIERFSTLADMVASWPLYWPPFFLLSRGLSAAAGTLTVVVVHAIGKRFAGRGAGLIAALFMSLAFLHVRDSHFGTTDVAMTLLAVASVWWLIRDDHAAAGRHSVWAAVSAGLATATKYSAMFLVVPIGLSALLQAVRAGRRRALPVFARRGAVLGGGFLLALSIGVPFVLFDFARFSTAMSQLAGSMRVGMTPQLGLPNGWWFHFSQSLRYGMGVPLLGLGLMGGVVMAFRDWPRALVFWAFPITCFAVAGAISNLFTRYVVPIVPFLCVGAAIAVFEIGRVIGARWRVHQSVAATLVAVAVVAPSAWSVVRFDRIMAHADNRVLVADWVQRHVPPGSSIAHSGSQYGQIQLRREHGFRDWRWDRRRQVFAEGREPARGRPDWILLQQSPLPSENQRVVLEWLESGYQLAAAFLAFDVRETGNVYDPQDMFYVPFGGFAGVTRPGSNFYVYKRGDLAPEGSSSDPGPRGRTR